MKRIVLSFAAILFLAGSLLADGYQVGDKARDFKLMNIDGKYVSMSDYKDAKGFIVIFTCNHCPYSKLYEDRIIALDQQFKGQGYPVIAINPNDSIRQPEDSYSKMIARADDKGFTFPYLLDADQSIARTYGAAYTPHVFLLQKEGKKFIVKYIGAIDDNAKAPEKVDEQWVEQAVAKLMDGTNPDPDYVKGIGCSIKWAK
jgi:peroxiredoxin